MQEASEDFIVCLLKLLPEVNTLARLVAISIVKTEDFARMTCELTLVTWSKGHDFKFGSLSK